MLERGGRDGGFVVVVGGGELDGVVVRHRWRIRLVLELESWVNSDSYMDKRKGKCVPRLGWQQERKEEGEGEGKRRVEGRLKARRLYMKQTLELGSAKFVQSVKTVSNSSSFSKPTALCPPILLIY